MVNVERLQRTFLDLVAIDSPSGKEGALGREVGDRLRRLGFEVRVDRQGNIIAVRPGPRREGQPVLFSAHLDTVVSNRGVQARLEDGVFRTDGRTILGADDKAGIAAILEACEILAETAPQADDVEVLFTVCEETGLHGSKALDLEGIRSRMGFVLDSGGPVGTIITAAPTEVDVQVTVFGKAAHAGVNPEDGVNAIQVAARALATIRLGRLDERTTANFGIIRGGSATNIVPDEVRVEGEVRSLSRDRLEQEIGSIRAAFERAVAGAGARLQWAQDTAYEGFSLGEDEPVVRAAARAAKAIGVQPLLRSRGGGSDANILNARGLPSVNLGLGVSQDHTPEETLSLRDLASAARLVLAIILGGA